MRLGILRAAYEAEEPVDLRAVREIREARVKNARKQANWREVAEVKRVGPRYFDEDGSILAPFFGEAFHLACPQLTPELLFIVGPANTLEFFQVISAGKRRA